MTTTEHALVEALYRVEGKAEIIDGEIVHLPMTGYDPNHAADEILVSLRLYAQRTPARRARLRDGTGFFVVDLPHRHVLRAGCRPISLGPIPGMKFVDGAPDFAVEVRSENDYGPAAERAMAAKRADYFAAGTQVVWDVDLLSGGNVVRVFRDGNSDRARRHLPARTDRRGRTRRARLDFAGGRPLPSLTVPTPFPPTRGHTPSSPYPRHDAACSPCSTIPTPPR